MAERDGVDVASFQGTPGQWSGAAGDIGWAAVKVTELSTNGVRYVNPDAQADATWLKQHGKGRIFYLYGHPNTSAAETASFFIAEVRKLGLDAADMVAVDLEETDGVTAEEIDDWSISVLKVIEHDLDRKPIVYTYLDFAATEGNFSSHGEYPLWISDPSSKPAHPRVPRPWREWTLHQYSISGNIDRDVSRFKTVGEMTAALGKQAAVHKATPVKPPKVKKHRARRAVAKVKAGTRKAAAGTKHTVKTEPVMTGAVASGGLSAAVVFLASHAGLHLTHTQAAAVITILTALAALYATVRTRKASVTGITGALSTIATASLAFGLHWPAAYLAANMPAASVVVGLLLRMHVSPRGALQDAEKAVASVVAAVEPARPVPPVPVAPPAPAPAVPVAPQAPVTPLAQAAVTPPTATPAG